MNGGGEDNGPIKHLSADSLPLFQEGIFLVLSRWSALQLAVGNEWGGRGSAQLADQLRSNIFSWFTQSKEPHYIDDLESILDEGMLSLNTMIEDGSIEEVAEKLMIMHEECLEGNYNSIEKLRRAGPSTGSHQHVRQSKSNQVNMQVDDPNGQEAQGEDGWTVVSSRKNRGKRN
ncbi:hypothetical protein GH714_023963 [Hevea brasiliensis]|uniref:Pre-rRNA-processing protein TSR2 homolog n=1 Tax=Hevea brasiliensis TaxID=3981 RepID=A0A6A6LBZ0_HEVBR|nr:hypothetical protein GH714_023963 [Hevea brasiliensis]